jgi:hypothetical protein
VLAHIFEAAGIATVVLSSVREVAVKVSPPRALHCEFPLGRPLGIPNDVEFQLDVLSRAFALLNEETGPVLVDHPVVIEADEQPVSCAIPPRFDASLPPSVDEARGIRKAYNRALERRGFTSVGRGITADEVPAALAVFHEIANGQDWTTAEIPGGNLISVCHDIRTYYEEAALELLDGPAPGGRAMENWFFETTEAGATLLNARTAMREAGAKFPVWFYMAPGNR